MTRLFLLIAAISGFTAVALGAFGAHALKNVLTSEARTIYQTANEYHFYHTLALFLLGLLGWQWPDSACLRWSGYTMIVGILLFSGSLYLLATTGIRWLGAITPLGGLAFLAAWLLLAVAVLGSKT